MVQMNEEIRYIQINKKITYNDLNWWLRLAAFMGILQGVMFAISILVFIGLMILG